MMFCYFKTLNPPLPPLHSCYKPEGYSLYTKQDFVLICNIGAIIWNQMQALGLIGRHIIDRLTRRSSLEICFDFAKFYED